MIFAAWCACCAMSVAAQDCEISLTIAKAAQKEELPSQVQEILGNRLAAAVAGQGSVANSNFTPFFITAKTNTLYKETLSGPPVSTALTVQLTLYIGDAVGQKVFSTLTVDAKGVGTNINRAYINAFRARKYKLICNILIFSMLFPIIYMKRDKLGTKFIQK